MKVNRKKPVVVVTLDSDVVEWIRQECAKKRCKTSQFVNQMLARDMEEELAKKANGGSSKLQSAG